MNTTADPGGQLPSQAEQFRRLLSEHPSSGQLWLDYARFLHNEHTGSVETVEALERAQSFFPEKDLRLRLGDALIEVGCVAQGLYQIYKFLGDNPKGFGYRTLAWHLIKLRKFRRAWKTLRKALLIEADNAETYCLIAELLSRSSRTAALPYCRKALELDPRCRPAWQCLGYILIGDERTRTEGLEALERAIRLDPNDAWAHAGLAVGYWLDGQLGQAEVHYRTATELLPEDEFINEGYRQFQEAVGGQT